MRRTWSTVALALLLGAVVAACGSPAAVHDPPTPTSVDTAVPGTRIVVTVPALPGLQDSSAAVTVGAEPTAAVTVPSTSQGSSTASSGSSAGPTPAGTTAGSTSGTTAPTATSTVASAPSSSPSSPSAQSPSVQSPSAQSPAGQALPVTLANCPGCTLIATRGSVQGPYGAALVATGSGRAVLLSLQPGGAVRGIINVPYGASFPAPANGVLACDGASRCVVTGVQADGDAVLSAFELTADGAWRDVSGNDAFPSATPTAATVDLDGTLGIAVQVGDAGALSWMVFGWDGQRYAVVGCAPVGSGGAVPPVGSLSLAACPS